MRIAKQQPDERESRAAVALTVAWMLTCMSTAAAMFVVLLLRVLALVFPAAAGGVHPLSRMADMFLFMAVVTGGLCLGMTLLAHRTRQTAPPRPITIAAVLIGFSPIVALIVMAAL